MIIRSGGDGSKRNFSRKGKEWGDRYNDLVGAAHPTLSRIRHREMNIWQRRFWEHQIKDDKDYKVHCDYIHYNPVRHGLVIAPKDWPHTSFHKYVKEGVYDLEWGSGEGPCFDGEVGNE